MNDHKRTDDDHQILNDSSDRLADANIARVFAKYLANENRLEFLSEINQQEEKEGKAKNVEYSDFIVIFSISKQPDVEVRIAPQSNSRKYDGQSDDESGVFGGISYG